MWSQANETTVRRGKWLKGRLLCGVGVACSVVFADTQLATSPEGKASTDRLVGHDRTLLHRTVREICRQAGITEAPPHGLRGTHADLALMAAATPFSMSKALGHESLSATYRHYADEGIAQSQEHERAIACLSPNSSGTSNEQGVTNLQLPSSYPVQILALRSAEKKLKPNKNSNLSVRERGLEPPHLAIPDPKSGASAIPPFPHSVFVAQRSRPETCAIVPSSRRSNKR